MKIYVVYVYESEMMLTVLWKKTEKYSETKCD